MAKLTRWKIPLAVGALGVLVVAFLAFRPDKLFVDDTVDESLEDAFASIQPTDSNSPAASPTTAPPAVDGGPFFFNDTATTENTGPRMVATGPFSGIGHRASGTATVYERDGRFVLRFEDDTDIQNGPDLYVWVLPTDAYTGGVPDGYLDLGKLKGNVGGQNYELPPEFDPAVHRAVLVWCLRFDVPFATAPLA